jgi:hypothetical protein
MIPEHRGEISPAVSSPNTIGSVSLFMSNLRLFVNCVLAGAGEALNQPFNLSKKSESCLLTVFAWPSADSRTFRRLYRKVRFSINFLDCKAP